MPLNNLRTACRRRARVRRVRHARVRPTLHIQSASISGEIASPRRSYHPLALAMASTMPSSIYPVRVGLAALAVALAVLLASPAAALSPVGQVTGQLSAGRRAGAGTP